MPRYVAFLRGVSPMNLRMPQLRQCFEDAGFESVRTLLSSGNVVFSDRSDRAEAVRRRAEQAMRDGLGRAFDTFLRTTDHLQALIDRDPFAGFEVPPGAKRIVTFLREPPPAGLRWPVVQEDARILACTATEAFTVYVPDPGRPVFMTLLQRTFGDGITTRTFDTVRKCAAA